jgi:hypothetical protein
MSSGGQDTEQAEQAVVAHSDQFYLQFNSNLANKDHTAHPLPDETVMKITDFMQRIKDGSTVGDLRIEHPRGYIFINKYDLINLVAAGGKPILVYRQKPDESGNMPPVDQSVRVSSRSTCFGDIRDLHIASGTHRKGNKLLDSVKAKFGASIPRWACEVCCCHSERGD